MFQSMDINNVVVSFGERGILKGVSLHIERGDKIAILGPSGEGKSTLLRVMMGLVKPQSGGVYIGGVPLERVLIQWRQIAFMLSQRSHLFRRSIRDNFLIAKEDATEDEMKHALSVVGMLERVKEVGGLDATVYEDFQPSGGEKSRLLLARGILRNPQVLILDEPLEGVDKESESEVIGRIREFAKEKTLIVVSHRLSILSMAEKFAIFENGTLTEPKLYEEHDRDSLLRRYVEIEKKMTEKFY